jgi:DNA-binding MarR family transcriptional regulator
MRWPGRKRVAVDLDPLQAAIVVFLLKNKAAPDSKLFSDVAESMYASRADLAGAVKSLLDREILEARLQPEDGSAWFVLGPLGKRLKGKIPAGVRSGIVVYA